MAKFQIRALGHNFTDLAYINAYTAPSQIVMKFGMHNSLIAKHLFYFCNVIFEIQC